MRPDEIARRAFLKGGMLLGATLGSRRVFGADRRSVRKEQDRPAPSTTARPPHLRFGVVGMDHSHINNLVDAVRRAGGEVGPVYGAQPEQMTAFLRRFPQAKAARGEAEVLEDPSVALVLSAAVPNERAALAVRAMQHGKDFLVDKPAVTTLEQLAEVRRVQAQTKRIFSVMYGRFENRATVRAAELVKTGAIGQVIQTAGLGPHRMNPESRPPWFFDRPKYGGILCDLASHQGDYFVCFTGSTTADVVSAQVGNVRHPEHPGLEDFGDAVLRGNRGVGYLRVDWFTPAGLSTWGDDRLTILGTDGYIEIRHNIDIAGRQGDSHLFLVDQKDTRYIDCAGVPLRFGDELVSDILNRTETAMSQAHCFLATEIILKAQQQAQRVILA